MVKTRLVDPSARCFVLIQVVLDCLGVAALPCVCEIHCFERLLPTSVAYRYQPRVQEVEAALAVTVMTLDTLKMDLAVIEQKYNAFSTLPTFFHGFVLPPQGGFGSRAAAKW